MDCTGKPSGDDYYFCNNKKGLSGQSFESNQTRYHSDDPMKNNSADTSRRRPISPVKEVEEPEHSGNLLTGFVLGAPRSSFRSSGSFRKISSLNGDFDRFRSIDSSTSGETYNSFQDINLCGAATIPGVEEGCRIPVRQDQSEIPPSIPEDVMREISLETALPLNGMVDSSGGSNEGSLSTVVASAKQEQINWEGNKPKKTISTFRRVLPQILATSAKNTLGLNFGFSLGFQTIAIPALAKPNDDLHLTPEQIAWFGSLFFSAIPIGCLFSGPCIHYWGRKSVMLFFCIPFYGAWWIYVYADSAAIMYCGILLHGLVNGLLEAPILTYVAEVCEPKWRGMLASASSVFTLIGIFMQFLIGNIVDWRTAAFINSFFPLVSFVTICFVPESPHWLASKGNKKKAEASLRWLRGWVEPQDVKKELNELLDSHQNSKDLEKSPTNWRLYMKGNFVRPFLLVLASFAIGHFSGMATIQTYSVTIYSAFGLNGLHWTAAMGAAQVLGATFTVFVLPFVGKRPIAVLFTAAIGVGLAIAATAEEGLPAALALLSANFATNATSRIIPWVLIGEVFTNELRAVASGLASCLAYLMGFLASLLYPVILEAVTLHGLLGIYAGVAFAGAIMFFFCLPETEGKSLAEVQQHYATGGKDNKGYVKDNPS